MFPLEENAWLTVHQAHQNVPDTPSAELSRALLPCVPPALHAIQMRKPHHGHNPPLQPLQALHHDLRKDTTPASSYSPDKLAEVSTAPAQSRLSQESLLP